MEIDLKLLLQIPLLLAGVYLFTVYMTRTFPILVGKRILLLIAHPDDEAMFFAPTLIRLSNPALGNKIFILCLSTGNSDGIGHIRRKELIASAQQLGITHPDHIVILDDPKFKDGMNETWDPKAIANILMRYFAPDASKTPRTAAPKSHIDVLITFDSQGVSGHPNHISLLHGATQFIRQLMIGRSGWQCPVKLYTLTTTNIVRKYSSFIDAMVTTLTLLWRKKERSDFPTPIVVVSGVGDWRKAQTSMVTSHQSQMRWFRWGWVSVGRYMVVNDLVRVKSI